MRSSRLRSPAAALPLLDDLLLASLVLASLVLASACVGPSDNPTKVVDLRVLGSRVEPPELMLESCAALDPRNPGGPNPLLDLLPFTQPVRYTALLQDPAGGGRPIRYQLFACTSQTDRRCEESERVLLTEGETGPGELVVPSLVGPSGLPLAFLSVGEAPDAGPPRPEDFLLFKVMQEDTFRGLGGIRVPLVFHVQAGDEEVYAQKLLVYNCRRVEGQQPNVNPVLPGLLLEGAPWPEGPGRTLTGAGPFAIEPVDFSALEEPYVVPSLAPEPTPLHLEESWVISWHTDHGRMQPQETGGADLSGQEGRHHVEWLPPADGAARETVRVWAVVRDGRGGQTWLERSFRYTP